MAVVEVTHDQPVAPGMVRVHVTVPEEEDRHFDAPLVGLTADQAFDALDNENMDAEHPLPDGLIIVSEPLLLNGEQVTDWERTLVEGDTLIIVDP